MNDRYHAPPEPIRGSFLEAIRRAEFARAETLYQALHDVLAKYEKANERLEERAAEIQRLVERNVELTMRIDNLTARLRNEPIVTPPPAPTEPNASSTADEIQF